MSQNENKS